MSTDDFQLELEFKRLEEELKRLYGSGSLYDGFGVKLGCTQDEIGDRFREKARQHHPDVSKEPDAEQRFKHINRINYVLSNPKRRASYDSWRKQQAGVNGGQQGPRPNESAYGDGYGGASNSWAGGFESSFRSGGREGDVFVNGVRLPTELFRGATVINNIAVSSDGRLYARVSGGRAEISNMPGGPLRVDDLEIMYENGRLTVTGKGVRNASVHAANRSVHMSEDRIVIESRGNDQGGLESEVNKAYDGVKMVFVDNSIEDLILGLSQDGKVYVKGNVRSHTLNPNGTLEITGLEGKLSLPKDYSVQFSIKTSSGDVTGDVAHHGIIETTLSSIMVRLYSPLNVMTDAKVGRVNVTGMVFQRDGVYTPPNAKSSGTLGLKTLIGDIGLDYVASAERQRAGAHAR